MRLMSATTETPPPTETPTAPVVGFRGDAIEQFQQFLLPLPAQLRPPLSLFG